MPRLPRKSKGDALGAEHVNQISRAAEIVLNMGHGGYAGVVPEVIRTVEVVAEGCKGSSNLWEVQFKYYDDVNNTWTRDNRDTEKYCMDATQLLDDIEVTDTLVVYWDHQRGAFRPLKGVSAASGGSGSGCTCRCVDEGDITVGGVVTTSHWTVLLPSVRIEEAFGYAEWPGGIVDIFYDEGDGFWSLDIGDEMTATYNSGNEATSDSTLTGLITFKKNDGGYTKLTITLTADIPNEGT
jgi:hypothetical protein